MRCAQHHPSSRTLLASAKMAHPRSLSAPPLGRFHLEAMLHPAAISSRTNCPHCGHFEARSCRPRARTGSSSSTPLADEHAIEKYGHVPLPPTAHAPTRNQTRAVPDCLAKERGRSPRDSGPAFHSRHPQPCGKSVRRADVILHVGAGTFSRSTLSSLRSRHARSRTSSASTAEILNETTSGGKIWDSRDTSVRPWRAHRRRRRLCREIRRARIFSDHRRFRAVDRLSPTFTSRARRSWLLVAAFAVTIYHARLPGSGR